MEQPTEMEIKVTMLLFLLLCNEALPNKIGGEFIHLPSKKKKYHL
jgi:hypothetical protein